MEELRDEAIEILESSDYVTIETGESSYEIYNAHDSIGGEDVDGWISEVLGNVVYADIRKVVNSTFDYIELHTTEIIEFVS